VDGRSKTSKKPAAPASQPTRKPRLLLVDPDPACRKTLEACAMQGAHLHVRHAGSLAQAHAALKGGRYDLVLVAQRLPDGDGLSLIESIGGGKRLVQTILLADDPRADLAVGAMRCGACDMLPRPLDMEQANQRIRAALARHSRTQAPIRRVRRLRKLCRKLNQDRLDVSAQVDVLCNDLVTAYQELADQMQQMVQGSEYGALVKHELDLEAALRTTLEFIVGKAGPCNAAIFLPATMDEYSLGGYVNYDCPGDSVDMLLDHMADVVAPRMTDREDVAHVTSDEQMHAWIGDDAYYLAESQMIAFAARHEGEALAVVALFRDQAQPFDRVVLDACAGIGPLLGEALARIIRVHHRHLPFDDEGEGFAGPDAPDDDACGGDDIPF